MQLRTAQEEAESAKNRAQDLRLVATFQGVQVYCRSVFSAQHGFAHLQEVSSLRDDRTHSPGLSLWGSYHSLDGMSSSLS